MLGKCGSFCNGKFMEDMYKLLNNWFTKIPGLGKQVHGTVSPMILII